MRHFIHLAILCLLLLSSVLTAHSPAILIVKGQHRKGCPPQSELSVRAQNIKSVFDDAGIATSSLPETSLTSQALRGISLVILPYNPGLQPAELKTLEEFVSHGGKLMAFYASNASLLKLLGLHQSSFVSGNAFGKPASIEFMRTGIPCLPKSFPQPSWNGIKLTPADKHTQIIARYLNQEGQPTGYPAITRNPNGFAFAHILLKSKDQKVIQAITGLAATAVPSIWKQTTLNYIEETGKIGGAKDLQQLEQLIPPMKRRSFAAAMAKVQRDLQMARFHAGKQNYSLALPYAENAYKGARQIYLLSRESKPGELRGAWIHSAYGIDDWGWDRTIKVLKSCGFNAVFPNMLWGYVADFRSNVLPNHPDVKTKGDQLQQCINACRKYGVQIHVWKVCWNMGYRTPKNLKDLMVRNHRTQMTDRGKTSDFLAPHLRENRNLEVRALADLVRNYAVDGVHLDYIRYPDSHCDFSPSARTAFQRFLGKAVKHWPGDCLPNGPFYRQYQQWRRNNISLTVRDIHRSIHAINPRVSVSAAVYGGWDDAPNSIAQDTETWIKNGWIDFVCPMNYSGNPQEFQRLTARQIYEHSPRIPVYAGIGSYLTPDAPAVAEQIEIARKLGAEGFLCFKLDRNFALDILPQLAKATTATVARPPFPHQSPMLSVKLAHSRIPALDKVFSFPEQVTAFMTFPPSFRIPSKLHARILRDGHYLPPAQTRMIARRQGQQLACAFLPTAPGTYRLELSDDATFASQSYNIHVLSPEETRTKLIQEGLPQFAKDGRPRIAVWQDHAYGASTITATLKASRLFDVAPLHNLKEATLNACHAIILPQPRRNAKLFKSPKTVHALQSYLQRGGSILVTHALVGIRGYQTLCPQIAIPYDKPLSTNVWQPNPRHPATATLPRKAYVTTFLDMIALKPGPQGLPLAFDRTGKYPVAVTGLCGKGRYVAMGMGWGIARGDKDTKLTEADSALLMNSVRWMISR